MKYYFRLLLFSDRIISNLKQSSTSLVLITPLYFTFIFILAVCLLVEEFVQTVEVRLLCAVQVVPPGTSLLLNNFYILSHNYIYQSQTKYCWLNIVPAHINQEN